jgi:hypothetical protein
MRVLAILCAAIAVGVLAPAAGAARADSPAQMRAVVHTWSQRLNAGDNKGIAQLFAFPATIVQAGFVLRLVNPAQVALWFSSLPCSGRVVSVAVQGRYATAVFVLGSKRPGLKCDGPGEKAAARFEIKGGKIRSWVQVPVPGSA